MQIGFSISGEGRVSANALTDVKDEKEFAEQVEDAGGDERSITLLDFTDLETDDRGDLGPAFEALRSLIGPNHFYEGSLCYAVEEMLEQVFNAGREFERNQAAKTAAPTPTEEIAALGMGPDFRPLPPAEEPGLAGPPAAIIRAMSFGHIPGEAK